MKLNQWPMGIWIMAGWLAILPLTMVHGATPQQVDNAIEKAKAHLYGLQLNGNWENPKAANLTQQSAWTSMAIYSLISAGESPQDPRIQQGITYLEHCQTNGVYALGLRCHVWLNMPQPYKKEIKEAFESDGEALIKGGRADGTLKETPSMFYGYETTVPNGYNHSTSQYGVLGIWACAQAGFEVPRSYWEAVDAGWRAHQHANGAWSYVYKADLKGHETPAPLGPGSGLNDTSEPRATMTAAGVATLFITQEYLHGMDGIECPGNIVDPNIEAGLKWMGENFNSVYDKISTEYYGLYGIERIGVASGRKYLGTVDWYQNGADFLIKHQDTTGGWDGLPDTCFGLLFLVRGRAPVVMNKLQYDLNMHGDTPRVANWNQRPRDVANVTHWIGKENERTLNWQVVSLKTPVEDLHDAPILYIAGNQALDFTDEELAKLKQFVEEGGLIVGNADCSSPQFSQGFHKVAKKLFPAYEFRDLPANSPIYTNEQFVRDKWKSKPKIEGLTNGARELMILIPTADPARYWQAQAYGGHEELAQMIDDIFLYSVDRGEKGGVRNKGETYVVRIDPNIKPSKSIKVARLEYAGNWDPEPGSWRRFAAILHNTMDTDLAVTSVKLGDAKLDNSYKLAHLTGVYKFSLPLAARNEIKNYIAGGGTLIVDACGGDANFVQSAEKELATIFPNDPLPAAPLAPNDPVYAVGPPLAGVEYRPWARKVVGKINTPRIRAITINGRPSIFFSGEDLSCGLVGMPMDGIYGYDVASATALMEKLVLFAGK